MALSNASIRNIPSVTGFAYYCYFQACYFAGLFRHAIIPILSGG